MTWSRARILGVASACALAGPVCVSRLLAATDALDAADVAALNTAIELERAGIKAYTDAATAGLLAPATLALLRTFSADHAAHRDALVAAVKAGGGMPSEKTLHLDYPSLKTETDILNFASFVERTAAKAYLDVVPVFKNRELAKTAASILGVETTHVAILGYTLRNGPAYVEPYPSAFVGA